MSESRDELYESVGQIAVAHGYLTQSVTYALNALLRAGYTTRAHIARCPDPKLLRVRCFGAKGLALVRCAIPYDPLAPLDEESTVIPLRIRMKRLRIDFDDIMREIELLVPDALL